MRIASIAHAIFSVTMIGLGIVGLLYRDLVPVWNPVPVTIPARSDRWSSSSTRSGVERAPRVFAWVSGCRGSAHAARPKLRIGRSAQAKSRYMKPIMRSSQTSDDRNSAVSHVIEPTQALARVPI